MKNDNHASRITPHVSRIIMKSNSGFSLVELLIASTITLLVLSTVYTAFIQTRKVSIRNQMDTEILQNARIGLDEMVRTLRMIGYRRDWFNGQVAIIEAAPFQVIFNADVYANQSALPPGARVKLYDATDYVAPMQNYTTGAETIRWTLDTNDDGIVDRRDTNDDEEEKLTSWNPNDMVFIKEINGGYDRQITLGVLGPFDVNDQRTNITPMFQYWLLEPDYTFSLLGDNNNDGQLDGDEKYFRSITSQTILQRIRRIHITITTESDGKDPLNPMQHRRVSLSSEVSLRGM
jgi:prepilin-type N-terminal cleavage/methylation domain-containing protein